MGAGFKKLPTAALKVTSAGFLSVAPTLAQNKRQLV